MFDLVRSPNCKVYIMIIREKAVFDQMLVHVRTRFILHFTDVNTGYVKSRNLKVWLRYDNKLNKGSV